MENAQELSMNRKQFKKIFKNEHTFILSLKNVKLFITSLNFKNDFVIA